MNPISNIDSRSLEAPEDDYGQDDQNIELVDRAERMLSLFRWEVLAKSFAEANYQKDKRHTKPEPVDFIATANSIIALVEADVRARLLSDGAKTAAGKNLYNNRVIELDQAGDDDWDILPWQGEWIEGAEDVLHAALTHIGIESEAADA